MGFKEFLVERSATYLLILAITIILYYSSFRHGFIQDDFMIIEAIKDNFNLYDIFVSQFLNNNFYRPITREIFYSVSYALFNLNPLGYHIISFTFFVSNCFLVYGIAERLLKRKDVALVASIFYASRGAHFTAVYWIAGFQEIGMTFFVLCSVLLYLLYIENRSKSLYVSSIICSLFALMSKETSIILPLLILLIEIYSSQKFRIDQNLKTLIYRISPFCIITFIYISRLFLNHAMISSGAYKMNFSLGTVVQNLAFYITNSFNNSFEIFILSVLILIAFLEIENRKCSLLSVIWFFVGLLPFIFLEEHSYPYYLSVSLVGLSLLLSIGVKYCYGKVTLSRYVLTPILIAILIISASGSINAKENLSAITIQEKTACNILSNLKDNFSYFPDGSLIYIKNSDERMYWALGFGSAIRLYYGNNISIYFEGVTKELPTYSQIYYFNYDNDTIYFIEKSEELKKSRVTFLEGWFGWEWWQGSPTRWISNNATMIVYSSQENESTLSTKVLSAYKSRILQVYLNDKLIHEQKIQTKSMKLEIPIKLKKGENIFRFYTPEGCQRPCDISELKSPDTRCLSFAFTNITVGHTH
jgi:hypothetical protein